MEFIDQLNDAQKEAVINTEGPSLVIAGAGAGKTRVLTYRIANLLDRGVPAHSILALTFTNKAAREMKERITDLVGPGLSRYLWMGTFHSIFSRILRMDGDQLGYQPNYTIYDNSDSKQVIRQIIKEMNLDDKMYNPGVIAARISAAKNNLVTAAMYSANDAWIERDKASRMPLMAGIFMQYASRCFRANAMDFDDLLLNTNILFRDFPDIRRRYQEKYRYILVDEYQDTNYAQYLIVKQLSELHGNLCVVGDDAQSIYSFRGARIENIFDFRNDFPTFRIFKLEQNYRSTQTIVEAANSIIDKNEGQIKKTIYSHNEAGEKIRVIPTMTDSDEGVSIAVDIVAQRQAAMASWKEFAILYRTNAQSRIFEEIFRKKDMPYRVYGGLSFYERKEIKDIIAWLRMIINPADEEAFRRSIQFPRRGIGETTLGKLSALAQSNNRTLWDISDDIDRYSNVFNTGTRTKIKAYTDLIRQFISMAGQVNAFTIAREVANRSGILGEFREGKTIEDISRLGNLEQLLNAIQEFTGSAENNGEPSELGSYLATISLLTDQDRDDENHDDRITLMTAHSAKGLEFNYVYITGLEENLFPSLMSSDTVRQLEEERRLFYVAITRARKMATLSYSMNRYKWGYLESSSPSRFIKEIDPRYLAFQGSFRKGRMQYSREDYSNFTGEGSRTHYHGPAIPGSGNSRLTIPGTSMRKLTATTGPSNNSPSGTDAASAFSPGDRVRHDRFGEGVILTIEGVSPDTIVVVEFNGQITRKLLLRFAKLEKV